VDGSRVQVVFFNSREPGAPYDPENKGVGAGAYSSPQTRNGINMVR